MVRVAPFLSIAALALDCGVASAQLYGGSSAFPDTAFLEGRSSGNPEAMILRDRGWQSVKHDAGYSSDGEDRYQYVFARRSAFGFPVTSAFVVVEGRDSRVYEASAGQKKVHVIYRVVAPYAAVVSAALKSTGLKSCYGNSAIYSCNTSRRFVPAVSARTPFRAQTEVRVTDLRRASGETEIEVIYPATFELQPLDTSKMECC